MANSRSPGKTAASAEGCDFRESAAVEQLELANQERSGEQDKLEHVSNAGPRAGNSRSSINLALLVGCQFSLFLWLAVVGERVLDPALTSVPLWALAAELAAAPEERERGRERGAARGDDTGEPGWKGALEAFLPKMLIIGTQKGGTTWLRSSLAAHPSLGTICKNMSGESTESPFLLRLNERKHSQDLVSFRREYAQYFQSQSCAGRVKFEEKPKYLSGMSGPAIASTISVLSDRVIIVASLRDPLTRMISFKSMSVCQHGTKENACGVEEHLSNMRKQSSSASVVFETQMPPILYLGLYARHLNKWREHVPANRMHIFFSEEMAREPLRVLNTIVGALGLDGFRELPKVDSKPSRQVKCKHEECGDPARKKLEEGYRTASICPYLQQLYAPENQALAEMLRSSVPLGWTQCPPSR